MAKLSRFNYQSLNKIKKYSLTVASFGGVDYTSQKFYVADNRAIDLLNYMYKGGFIQKRNGVEQIYNVPDFKYIPYDFNGNAIGEEKYNSKNFNGIWKFEAEDGNIHIIAHIGHLLYEITNIESENKISFNPFVVETTTSGKGCYEYLNQKSFAFVGNNKLWFFGGNKYMCIRYDSSKEKMVVNIVENNKELTPIPTTTISITYNNSKVGGNRQSLDNTNLLTQWRRNRLLSGTKKTEYVETEPNYTYVLDAPIITKNGLTDMADFVMTIQSRKETK